MEKVINFSNDINLLVKENSGINFTEDPLPKFGAVALKLNGTQPEIEEFLEGYLKMHPSTIAISDAYFVGKRLPKWGDPNMEWKPEKKSMAPDLYEITLIRKME